MPVISMFYGIIVQLYFFDNDKHNLPHIHIRYAEHNASIAIEGNAPFKIDPLK